MKDQLQSLLNEKATRSAAGKLRRQLKKLTSFEARLQERQRLGQDAHTIAQYVCVVVEGSRNPSSRSERIDECKLPSLLSPDEWIAYQRAMASRWAHRQRKNLESTKILKKQLDVKTHHQADEIDQRRRDEATLRKNLRNRGAVSITEVARRLNISVSKVRQIHASGELPSAGFVPVQYSRGRPVHLWLPSTILRYLNRL